MRLRCRDGLVWIAVGVCGCGSPSDLIIGSQADAGAAPSFRLLWHDDFDAIDMSRWALSTHTFAENYADFAVENAVIAGGRLDLRVLAKPSPFMGKPYTAAEIRTRQEFTFGKFLTSARFAKASGVVSTLFS